MDGVSVGPKMEAIIASGRWNGKPMLFREHTLTNLTVLDEAVPNSY
jgi:hypothetical protein